MADQYYQYNEDDIPENLRREYIPPPRDPWDQAFRDEAEWQEEYGTGAQAMANEVVDALMEAGDTIGDALGAAAEAISETWDEIFSDKKDKVDEPSSS